MQKFFQRLKKSALAGAIILILTGIMFRLLMMLETSKPYLYYSLLILLGLWLLTSIYACVLGIFTHKKSDDLEPGWTRMYVDFLYKTLLFFTGQKPTLE